METDQRRLLLVRVLWGLLGVTPLRFVLAAGTLLTAIAAGAASSSARVAFGLGLVGGAGLVLGDPRRRMLRREIVFRPAPDVFDLEEPWRSSLRGLYPSSLGLTVLSLVALAWDPVLSAVLAGVIAGLGVAGLISAVDVALQERRLGGRVLSLVGARMSRGAVTLFVAKG
jgi:hypothetical protein